MLITRPCLTPLLLTVLVQCDILPSQLSPFTNTCLKSPSYPHTLGVALCRYSVVVGGVSSESLREGDGGHSTLGGGGVPVDQVGVGWVCTIVNGAGVPWLKCALYKHIAWFNTVNVDSKNICATCEVRAYNCIQ